MAESPSTLVKVSFRMPKSLLRQVSKLHPKENISGLMRQLVEREIMKEKVLKAHMKLYGRFKPEDFDESLL